jgi:hypothetical protein
MPPSAQYSVLGLSLIESRWFPVARVSSHGANYDGFNLEFIRLSRYVPRARLVTLRQRFVHCCQRRPSSASPTATMRPSQHSGKKVTEIKFGRIRRCCTLPGRASRQPNCVRSPQGRLAEDPVREDQSGGIAGGIRRRYQRINLLAMSQARLRARGRGPLVSNHRLLASRSASFQSSACMHA